MTTKKTNIATYATKATAVRGAKRANARYAADDQCHKVAEALLIDGMWTVVEVEHVADSSPVCNDLPRPLELDLDLDDCLGSVTPADAATDGVNVCPLCQTVDHNRTWYTEGVTMQCHDCNRVYSATTGKEVVIKATERTNKSTVESPTKLVWRIADSMKGARRKDIIAACEAAGVAYYTARTQYQHYTTAVKEQAKNATK